MADTTSDTGLPARPAKAGAAAPAARTEAVPRHPFLALRQEIDRLFEDFLPGSFLAPFGRRGGSGGGGGGGAGLEVDPWRRFQGALGMGFPAVDLAETDKGYRITAELPGMAEKGVELTLANGVLTLTGEKREEREEKEKDYHVAERRYGSFRRSFRLPEDVDGERIDATCKDGVLTVTLPKTGQARAGRRRIEVKAA